MNQREAEIIKDLILKAPNNIRIYRRLFHKYTVRTNGITPTQEKWILEPHRTAPGPHRTRTNKKQKNSHQLTPSGA